MHTVPDGPAQAALFGIFCMRPIGIAGPNSCDRSDFVTPVGARLCFCHPTKRDSSPRALTAGSAQAPAWTGLVRAVGKTIKKRSNDAATTALIIIHPSLVVCRATIPILWPVGKNWCHTLILKQHVERAVGRHVLTRPIADALTYPARQ